MIGIVSNDSPLLYSRPIPVNTGLSNVPFLIRNALAVRLETSPLVIELAVFNRADFNVVSPRVSGSSTTAMTVDNKIAHQMIMTIRQARKPYH